MRHLDFIARIIIDTADRIFANLTFFALVNPPITDFAIDAARPLEVTIHNQNQDLY